MQRSSRLVVQALAFCVGVGSALPALGQEDQFTGEQVQAGYRLYTGQCQLCHGPNGDGISGINLAHQQFHHVVSDDDIRSMIKTGNPQGMPPFTFKPDELDDLVAFIRSGFSIGEASFRLGNAARGRVIYDKAGCIACHRVDGAGSRMGPDLSDIGFVRQPGQIQISLIDPNKETRPINRPVTIVTKDGRTIHGRRLNEDTFSVQLIDQREDLLSIPKSDISKYDVITTTEMPSYKGKLSDDELADLLAYLVSLKRH